MLLTFCKTKISNVTVTQCELYYAGSITIDQGILKAADLLPGEKVEVLNMNNGSRIETFVIAGKANAGEVCLNGPAARWGCVGDKLIILSYCLVDKEEAKNLKPKILELHDRNKIKN